MKKIRLSRAVTRTCSIVGAGLLLGVSGGLFSPAFATVAAPADTTHASAQAVSGTDGLSVDIQPDLQSIGSAQGFTVTVGDTNPTGTSFSEYYVAGLPADWSVLVGGTKVDPQSPQPVIYSISKGDLQSGNVRIVAPSTYEGTLPGVTISRVSSAQNLVTDFDNGTFDYIGTAKPQLSPSQSSYTYHDPTVLGNAPDMGCSTLQYAPCDGSYSIWPTGNMNGPGDSAGNHYNNFWADVRSVDRPMQTPSTEVISKDWDKTGGPVNIQAVNTAQVTDAESAASGKILVVNGATKLPVPNDLIRTTISNLQPNSIYTVTGYIANLSDAKSGTAEVRSSFFASTDDGSDELIGSSQPLPRQDSGYNTGISMWQKTVGYVKTGPNQTSITVGVRNFGAGGFGNDLAIDNLRLSPMSSVSFPLSVAGGSVSWSKVDSAGQTLAGSEWSLAPESGPAIDVVDNGDHDADSVDGKLKVVGLPWGKYTLTETKAPTGYAKSNETKTITIDKDGGLNRSTHYPGMMRTIGGAARGLGVDTGTAERDLGQVAGRGTGADDRPHGPLRPGGGETAPGAHGRHPTVASESCCSAALACGARGDIAGHRGR